MSQSSKYSDQDKKALADALHAVFPLINFQSKAETIVNKLNDPKRPRRGGGFGAGFGGGVQRIDPNERIFSVREWSETLFVNASHSPIQDFGHEQHARLGGSSLSVSFNEFQQLCGYAKQHGRFDHTIPNTYSTEYIDLNTLKLTPN